MKPVKSFRLLKFGRVETDRALSGKSFEFTPAHAEAAVEWFSRRGNELMIDFDHQSFPQFNSRSDGLAPAAGWIGGVEVRSDGLWARDVTWTDEAHALIASGQYRYYSPVIFWRGGHGKALRGLGPVALTNDPAMADVPALAAARGRDDDEMSILSGENLAQLYSEVYGLLGLQGNPTMDEVLATVSEQNRAHVAALLGLPETASLEEVREMMRTLMFAPGGEPGGKGGGSGELGAGTLPTAQVMRIAKELGIEAGDEATLLSRLKDAIDARKAATAQLGELIQRVGQLEAKTAEQEFESICSTSKRISPAQKPGMLTILDRKSVV